MLEAGQYVVVAVNRDPDAFPARYPDPGINLADGVYTGHLDNTGERVTLLDANDQSILDFTYSDLWYPTTDGEGPSLVVKDPLLDPATWNDAASWRPSFADGGSPGSADAQADTTPPTADMIDVTPNPRRAPVDSITIVFTEPVSGFDLSDVRLSRDGTLGNLLTAAQTLTTADNVTWTVGNLSAITAEPGYYAANLRAASGIVDAAGNALVAAPSAFWTTLPPVWVVGRSVFYNNSSYDGNTPGIDAADAGAIATDKQALIPGRAVSAANYTNYTRGINGLMIDLTGRWTGQPLTADDFAFKVGSTPGGADWIDAPAPSAIDDRPTGLPGNELGGPERVTFVWPDGAIRNAWLQVTVKANDRTALAEPHVFYFGNLAGDTGDGAITAVVNALDLAAVKRALNTPADVTSRLDFDRSGRINALDLAAVKSNLNRSLSLQGAAPARIAAAAAFSIVPITAPSPLAPSRAWDEAPVDPLARA